MSGPLVGLRVLDLSRVLAGPWCTQILGDMGADVIKVERPEFGDDTRQFGPPWLTAGGESGSRESTYFLSANRSKRSITVDLGCHAGQEIIRSLALKCDILIENFKTGDLATKRLGYEDIRALNPRLIYCSITGFGATGPQAGNPGYDYLIQAQGGLMSLTGHPDGAPGAGPMRVGLAVSDLTTGMNAAIAILAALHHRHHTGEGQWIELALLDVQVSWLANHAQSYFATGAVPARTGDQHASIVPYQPFATMDGLLIVAIGNDAQFRRLCAVLGCADVGKDARFQSNAARVQNRKCLVEIIGNKIASWTTNSLQSRLRSEGIPSGPIQTLEQVFSDPQVLAREMVVELKHGVLGSVKTVANPTRFSATRIVYERAPPTLGQDTSYVLSEFLGLNTQAVDDLRSHGVV
jgi:crotonobetainyl-CoA:carnitine CoA-transferase CaiB-like acyl-CoA transferase